MAATVSRLLFSCFVLSGPSPGPSASSYCETSNCPDGVQNIGCNPPPPSGAMLCSNFQALDLGEGEQAFIVDAFNEDRNEIAAGPGYPFVEAKRMLKLTWDAELAKQAGHNLRTCTGLKDDCRNTAKYSNVGQVIQQEHLYGGTVTNMLLTFTAQYWAESYTKGSNSKFADVYNDKAVAVGCALGTYDDRMGETLTTFVCNFSDSKAVGEDLYVYGSTASGCKTGSDTQYTNLCSSMEVL